MLIKQIYGKAVKVIFHEAIVIGTGCAGYNAADSLYNLGCRDVAIVTEGIKMGTSRNTGSDKQTYYKLSLSGDGGDSVYELAQTLFKGSAVHGDIALAEAAGSVRAFMKLVNLGVPFPTNSFGEYVGYKTDHDPRQRATSCGPLTSKLMTQALECEVLRKNIMIYDGFQVVKIMTEKGIATGLIALNLSSCDSHEIAVFVCNNIIMATGGPAIAYKSSVYPHSQTGMSGVALSAGAVASNLNEWQYGLASTKFRWNVSGSYQQVLPRYVCVDSKGRQREFLPEYFSDASQALDMVFLKGYQWPFDSLKVSASSMIDIIVHNEIVNKGNRVYMDFTQDPIGLEHGFDGLASETLSYLQSSNILVKTPIERLKILNPQAIELYKNNGIDITKEMLEVAVCAQHCNGGIAVDANWQSSIDGLYVVGEAAATFGVARPGGSALNSTQVGSFRAAEHIAYSPKSKLKSEISSAQEKQIQEILLQIDNILAKGEQRALSIRDMFQTQMSNFASHIRNMNECDVLSDKISLTLRDYEHLCSSEAIELSAVYKNLDMLYVQLAMLSAMRLSAKNFGSRGGAIVTDENGEIISPDATVTKENLSSYRYSPRNEMAENVVIETVLNGNSATSKFALVRPLEKSKQWFETVWNEFEKKRKNM